MRSASRYETLVYSIFNDLGCKFQKQAQISGYSHVAGKRHRYDALFRLHRLAIEIDGCWYHGCLHCFPNSLEWQLDARKRDGEIDRNTRLLGWTIRRIPIHALQS